MDSIQLWHIVVLLLAALVGGAVVAVLLHLARQNAPRRIDGDGRIDGGGGGDGHREI